MCGVAEWRTIMSQRARDSLGPIGSSLPSMKGVSCLSDVGKAHARDVGKTKTVNAWSLLNLFGIFLLLGCRATFTFTPSFHQLEFRKVYLESTVASLSFIWCLLMKRKSPKE